MATITLGANSNYSALTVANGDTIALAGYTLTLDVNPAQINVTVTAVGNAGRIVLGAPNNYALSGWTMQAGVGLLVLEIPAGKSVGGTWMGGTAGNSYAINTNNGTVESVQGGSGTRSHGTNMNNGTIVSAVGGSAANSSAFGVSVNNGTVVTATGSYGSGVNTNFGFVMAAFGSAIVSASGVATNQGVVGAATGGSAANAYGVARNRGVIESIVGGSVSNAYGVNNNESHLVMLQDASVWSDNTAPALGANATEPARRIIICRGDALQGAISAGFTAIYHIGPINEAATFVDEPELIPLESGPPRHPLQPPYWRAP